LTGFSIKFSEGLKYQMRIPVEKDFAELFDTQADNRMNGRNEDGGEEERQDG
jgi:hypothetical protein